MRKNKAQAPTLARIRYMSWFDLTHAPVATAARAAATGLVSMSTRGLIWYLVRFLWLLIRRRMRKNKAQAPTLARIRYMDVFRFNPRSRCNSSSRCCYRAREHVDLWSDLVPGTIFVVVVLVIDYTNSIVSCSLFLLLFTRLTPIMLIHHSLPGRLRWLARRRRLPRTRVYHVAVARRSFWLPRVLVLLTREDAIVGDRSSRACQALCWPQYASFSVGGVSQGGKPWPLVKIMGLKLLYLLMSCWGHSCYYSTSIQAVLLLD